MKCVIGLSVALIASLVPARADVITILSATSIANATAERDAWITSNFGLGASADVNTTFETDATGQYNSLSTGIGTFSILAGGLGSTSSGTGTNQFSILNSGITPFSGRYNTTAGGANWLDSNDITKLQLSTTANAIFFFITDVNDAGGNLQIQTGDGSSSGFSGPKTDGNIYFVGISSTDAIGTLQWLNNVRGDGFGLDDFGVIKYSATVPEPASLPIAGVGLLIAAMAVELRKRYGVSQA